MQFPHGKKPVDKASSPRIKGSDATLVQSRVCLTAPIFTSARASGHQALAGTPSQCTTHHTDDLAGSLGLSCVLGASLEEMLGEDSPLATSMPATPATEVQPEDHRNALHRKVLQKTPVLAMAQAQTCRRSRKCTKVASEPIRRRWSFTTILRTTMRPCLRLTVKTFYR